jgi:hypothetical protein
MISEMDWSRSKGSSGPRPTTSHQLLNQQRAFRGAHRNLFAAQDFFEELLRGLPDFLLADGFGGGDVEVFHQHGVDLRLHLVEALALVRP